MNYILNYISKLYIYRQLFTLDSYIQLHQCLPLGTFTYLVSVDITYLLIGIPIDIISILYI